MFSWEFYDIFNNTFFIVHLRWLLLRRIRNNIEILFKLWFQGKVSATKKGVKILLKNLYSVRLTISENYPRLIDQLQQVLRRHTISQCNYPASLFESYEFFTLFNKGVIVLTFVFHYFFFVVVVVVVVCSLTYVFQKMLFCFLFFNFCF